MQEDDRMPLIKNAPSKKQTRLPLKTTAHHQQVKFIVEMNVITPQYDAITSMNMDQNEANNSHEFYWIGNPPC
jgi:hypothetical protein